MIVTFSRYAHIMKNSLIIKIRFFFFYTFQLMIEISQ